MFRPDNLSILTLSLLLYYKHLIAFFTVYRVSSQFCILYLITINCCTWATWRKSNEYHEMCLLCDFPVVVVVAFFVCWAPFQAQRLVAIYGEPVPEDHSSSSMIDIYQMLTYVSGILYYLSTTINPLLYNLMSHKFRTAFKVSAAESSPKWRFLVRFAMGIRTLLYGVSCRGNFNRVHTWCVFVRWSKIWLLLCARCCFLIRSPDGEVGTRTHVSKSERFEFSIFLQTVFIPRK